MDWQHDWCTWALYGLSDQHEHDLGRHIMVNKGRRFFTKNLQLIFHHVNQLIGKISDLLPLVDISMIFWRYLVIFLMLNISSRYFHPCC